MAAIKSIMWIFTTLLSLYVVLAQEQAASSNSFPFLSMIPTIPSIPGIPTIPGIPNFFSSLPTLPSFSGFTRQRRQADLTEAAVQDGPSSPANEHDPEHEHQDRLFFTLFPTLTGCNYTANPGRSCTSCTQTLNCFSSNVGFRQNCRGLFRFCNNGFCSLSRGTACDTTATNSTTGG